MSAGGLTFGAVKTELSVVCENGINPNDPRVVIRTNEAIRAILDEGIWVNSMMTVDVMGSGPDGDELFLPKELENIVEAQVLNAAVYGDTDKPQAWYNVVNGFTYIDPQAAEDYPLQDLFLQPDPGNPSVLRRKYKFIGLTPNAIVRCTGAKRYVPITQDNDYLIVQNVLAIKDMIQSIWRKENNDPQGSEILHKACIDRLTAEVKKHQLDPRNIMRRKSEYYKDIQANPENCFLWMRASLALEVPALFNRDKIGIGWLLNQAEKRLMQRGLWKDTIQEFRMKVDASGLIAFPREVQSVLGADLHGHPIPIRNVLFEYLENGPGMSFVASDPAVASGKGFWRSTCSKLVDQGDEDFQGGRRRVYKLTGPFFVNSTETTTVKQEWIRCACKLRWLEKKGTDQMIIKNFEALRNMVQCIINEEEEKWDESAKAEAKAFEVLEAENREYLAGLLITPRVQMAGFGMGHVGRML